MALGVNARVALVVAAIFAFAAPADAAVFKVSSTADGADGNASDSTCAAPLTANACTLRAAVQSANASGGADEIVLPAGTYRLSLGGQEEDAAARGDLDVGPGGLTIRGAGAATTTIDGALGDRILHVLPGSGLTLAGVTLANGAALDGFGGGGILNRASLTVTDVALSQNRSRNGGGGLYNNGGSATLTGVTFSGNSTFGNGGAIWNFGGQLAVTNATLAGNASGGGGAAVRNDGTSSGVRLANTTVSSSTSGVAISNNAGPGNLTLVNTILGPGAADNCAGPVGSGGHNIDSGHSCVLAGPGDRSDTNPLLGPLAANGGQTPTQALLAGSPAIDSGDPAACPGTDQRGTGRQGTCDIGAYEFKPGPPPPPPAISARLLQVRVVKVAGKRQISIRLEVGESVAARITLLRATKKVASKTIRLRAGTSTLRLAVPQRAKAGRYQLQLVLDAGAGRTKKLSRALRL